MSGLQIISLFVGVLGFSMFAFAMDTLQKRSRKAEVLSAVESNSGNATDTLARLTAALDRETSAVRKGALCRDIAVIQHKLGDDASAIESIRQCMDYSPMLASSLRKNQDLSGLFENSELSPLPREYELKLPNGHVSRLSKQSIEDALSSNHAQSSSCKVSPRGQNRWVSGKAFLEQGNVAFENVEPEDDLWDITLDVLKWLWKNPSFAAMIVLVVFALAEIATAIGYGFEFGPGPLGKILHDFSSVTAVPGWIVVSVLPTWCIAAFAFLTGEDETEPGSWTTSAFVPASLMFFSLIAFGMLNIRTSNGDLISRSIATDYSYLQIPTAQDVLIPGTNRYSTRQLGTARHEAKTGNYWDRLDDRRLFFPSFWQALYLRG